MALKTTKAKCSRILIVDDHYVVRQGLKQVLAERFGDVDFGEASDGNEALQHVWNGDWSVVLLDVAMPGRGGLDTLKEVLRAKPKLPVIIVSMHSEEIFAVRALKLGASSYIRKDCAGVELVAAVEAALRGQQFITPLVALQLARQLKQERGDLPHEVLSDREFQVFCLLGSGVIIKEVADRLSLSAKTISTYRTRILEKMGLKNTSQIIHYVVEHGLSTTAVEEIAEANACIQSPRPKSARSTRADRPKTRSNSSGLITPSSDPKVRNIGMFAAPISPD